MVPEICCKLAPCFLANATYKAKRINPVALIVIDVLTFSKSMPLKSNSMSSKLSIATPTFPTSPSEREWSESYPIWVGKSNATLNPVTPCDNK